jgi:endonuclease/exonuclease/phosphatase family metal-dependent hydrolase
MTWNIHGGLGTDRRFDLARVVETILRHHPDVVALQEVDSRRTVAPASSAFRVLREAVGGHGVEAKSIIAPDGEYGQVVLSRWPLGAPQIHDITHAEREPRRAIEVEVAAPAGSFKLIATLGMGSRPSRPRRLWLWIPGSTYARGPGMTEGERARPGITERSHKLRAMSTFMISLVPA